MTGFLHRNKTIRGLVVFLQSYGALLLVLILLTAVMLQILAYVVPHDAGGYILSARSILRAPPGSPEMKRALTFVSPVYPLMLAGAIKVFGLFAPYWFNFVLALGFFAILRSLLQRLLKDSSAEAVVLVTTLFVLIVGFPANAHFLLYPFRELPSFFFVLLGMLLTMAGGNGRRYWMLFAAGVSFLLAIGIREPAMCGVVGPLIWLMVHKDGSRRRRWTSVVCFLMPFLLAFSALMILSSITGTGLHHQLRGGIGGILEKSPAELAKWTIWKMRVHLNMLRGEMGWLGVALLGIGIWRSRRNRGMLLFFLATGICFFLFYSICPWKLFPRYVLSSFMFLCPMIGIGAYAVLEWGRLLWKRAFGQDLGRALHVVAVVCLALLFLWQIRLVGPAGVCSSRKEVLAFREKIERLHPEESLFIAEKRCANLQVALGQHTSARIIGPQGATRLLSENPIMYFFKPLNDACFARSKTRNRGVRAKESLLSHGDLIPIADGDNRPAEVVLEEERYAVCQYNPWRLRTVKEPVTLVPGNDTIIWLDFRNFKDESQKSVRILTARGEPIVNSIAVKENGIQGVCIPGSSIKEETAYLNVSSTNPLPALLVAAVQSGPEFVAFSQMEMRKLSTEKWFLRPFSVPSQYDKYGALFCEGGTLRLPVPYGDGYCTMKVHLAMSAAGYPGKGEVRITYRHEDNVLASEKASLEWCLENKHSFEIPDLPFGGYADIDISVDPPDCRGGHFRVHQVAISVRKSSTSTRTTTRTNGRNASP